MLTRKLDSNKDLIVYIANRLMMAITTPKKNTALGASLRARFSPLSETVAAGVSDATPCANIESD
jgi:hypothetical protein